MHLCAGGFDVRLSLDQPIVTRKSFYALELLQGRVKKWLAECAGSIVYSAKRHKIYYTTLSAVIRPTVR